MSFSPFSPRPAALLAALFSAVFLLLSWRADSWPGKRTIFFAQNSLVLSYARLPHPDWSLRYSPGHAKDTEDSLWFLLLLKALSAVLPARLLCLRILSLLASVAALAVLYRLARRLFGPPEGLGLLFLLVTAPASLETLRAFGFIPLTNLVAVSVCLLAADSRGERFPWARIALLSALSYLLLSLYSPGRLVILFVLALFALSGRRCWGRGGLYLGAIVLLILASDQAAGPPGFDPRKFFLVGEEWMQKEGREMVPDWGRVPARVAANLRSAGRYLAHVGRVPFHDDDPRSRIFNPLYVPFLALGVAVCLARRNPSDRFLLLWALVLFGVPLASDALYPRRIILALPAVYCLISVGACFSLRWLFGRVRTPSLRRALAAAFALYVLSAGAFDVREFLFAVSKPQYDYNRSQLAAAADFLIARAGAYPTVRYTIPTRDLVWGNPYFVDRLADLSLGERIRRDENSDPGLVDRTAAAAGESALYLYTLPALHPNYGEAEYARLFAALEEIRRTRPEAEPQRIPGTDIFYLELGRR